MLVHAGKKVHTNTYAHTHTFQKRISVNQAHGWFKKQKTKLPYIYKSSRDLNFADFTVGWQSMNFSSLKIHNYQDWLNGSQKVARVK